MPQRSKAARKIATELTESAALIQATDVSYSIGKQKIIDSVSLTGDVGQVIGLLGPNGAGKTTMLRLLTGNLTPQSGSIMLAGLAPQRQRSEVAKHVGYLPEGAPLWRERLGIDIIEMIIAGNNYHGEQKQEHLSELVKLLDLGSVLTNKVETLSKGMRRRLALALALAGDPQILILDEPSDGLDPAQQIALRATLGQFAKTKAIIISSHNLDEIASVCNKVYILNSGKIAVSHDANEMQRLRSEPKGLLENYLRFT